MSLAMQEVQQALITRLTGDALVMDRVSAVYDTVPQGSAVPYMVIEQIEQETIEALGEEIWRVGVILEVWTDAKGRKEALSVLERLQALLHHGALNIDGHALREMRVDSAGCVLAEQATRVVGSIELTLIVAEN
jgi:hypothetical protein